MKVINTGDPTVKPSVVMLVYGEGGVGKTTFGSTAPNPLLLDFENGSKYFGLRGISVDVVQIEDWARWATRSNPKPNQEGTLRDSELIKTIREGKYETIIIDPIGEAMEKLINSISHHPDSKLRQKDGSPTMAGWGYIKKTMRDFIKFLRDSGKNVILIAHLDEKEDEQRMVKRPMIATKISQELVNMVDIVGYMTTNQIDGEEHRVIIVDPANDKYTAKDRTGQLDSEIEPDFTKIVKALAGDGEYKWCKAPKVKKEGKKEDVKVEDKPEESESEDIEFPEDTDNTDNAEPKQADLLGDKLAEANKKKNGGEKE